MTGFASPHCWCFSKNYLVVTWLPKSYGFHSVYSYWDAEELLNNLLSNTSLFLFWRWPDSSGITDEQSRIVHKIIHIIVYKIFVVFKYCVKFIPKRFEHLMFDCLSRIIVFAETPLKKRKTVDFFGFWFFFFFLPVFGCIQAFLCTQGSSFLNQRIHVWVMHSTCFFYHNTCISFLLNIQMQCQDLEICKVAE